MGVDTHLHQVSKGYRVVCGMWIQVVISEFQNVDKTEIEFQPNIMKEAGVHKKQHDRQRNMRTNVRSIVLCGA